MGIILDYPGGPNVITRVFYTRKREAGNVIQGKIKQPLLALQIEVSHEPRWLLEFGKGRDI
jgi:hypothetical protein